MPSPDNSQEAMDLFGDTIDEFKSAKERYGVWPITVWDCDKSSRITMGLKRSVGDDSQHRRGEGQTPYGYMDGISVFDPAVASWILNCYAPTNGLCFDPFAGGGTRAIMAAKHGLAYLGVELRAEEVEAVKARCERCRVSDSVHIECGDSRDCSQIASTASADFCYTCPPYHDLEQYNGGPADLSMCGSYKEFIQEMRRVVQECFRVLKPGTHSVWVVGLTRDKTGNLLCLNHDITGLHRSCGFTVKEEIILSHKNNGAVTRVGNFDKGRRLLIRTHEYALVFQR